MPRKDKQFCQELGKADAPSSMEHKFQEEKLLYS